MEYKIEPKEIPSYKGMVDTITSITIKCISADRDKQFKYADFVIFFQGFTKDLNGKSQNFDIPPINLSSEYMVRQVREQIYADPKPTTPPEGADEATQAAYQDALTAYTAADTFARSQIDPLVGAILWGTTLQAYQAAAALATQYGYTVLPFEDQ